jgi:hypothetical protein
MSITMPTIVPIMNARLLLGFPPSDIRNETSPATSAKLIEEINEVIAKSFVA